LVSGKVVFHAKSVLHKLVVQIVIGEIAEDEEGQEKHGGCDEVVLEIRITVYARRNKNMPALILCVQHLFSYF
jgi:hypothetical protein